MKSKLSFLSMVIVTLSLLGLSCSKDVAADAAPESREPITFNVSNETITRGEIVTEINEFVVYAVDVDGAVIGNATFTKNDEGVWSPDNTLYWTGNEIKFYAYLSSSNFTAEGTTLKGYQMPADVTAQDDLMVAQFTASSG
ncbi:MAG: fimbrillin family protein, partial [Rikenellaceae bacterium]